MCRCDLGVGWVGWGWGGGGGGGWVGRVRVDVGGGGWGCCFEYVFVCVRTRKHYNHWHSQQYFTCTLQWKRPSDDMLYGGGWVGVGGDWWGGSRLFRAWLYKFYTFIVLFLFKHGINTHTHSSILQHYAIKSPMMISYVRVNGWGGGCGWWGWWGLGSVVGGSRLFRAWRYKFYTFLILFLF